MYLRTFGGLIILFVAFEAQALLAGAGIYADLVFAALITFASVFDFWELALFTALSIFLINWEPALSGEILVFAVYPFAVYFTRNLHASAMWLRNALAIFIGFVIFYLAAMYGISFSYAPSLAIDLAIEEFFGILVFLLLYSSRPL